MCTVSCACHNVIKTWCYDNTVCDFFNPCITTYLNIRGRRPRLLISSDRWKYNISLGIIVFICSRKRCLYHIFLLGVFTQLSMFFTDKRVLHVILMHHQQIMPFPNMLSVQSLCRTSIEKRGTNCFSMDQTFHSDFEMVVLNNKYANEESL